MQPNQNMSGAAGASSTPNVPNAPSTSPAPNNTAVQMDAALRAQNTQSGSNMMQGGNINKKKSGKGAIYGMIFLAILAIAGIGFGVWAMMDGNTQKESLNSQISTLKQQNSDLMDQINEKSQQGTGSETTDARSNPIIKTNNDDSMYKVFFLSEANDKGQRVRMLVKDGKISSCSVETPNGDDSWGGTDCSVTGLDGDIYKIVQFGAGQDNHDDKIGFIMTDGSIKYLPLYESINNNDFSIRGSVKTDNEVVDIVKIVAGPTVGVGGYVSSIFVMKDGTFVEYSDSMLY